MDRRQRSDLLSQLRRDARSIAGHFELRYRGIAAEHPRVKSRYGACYEDGLIKIRLNHATTGRPLKYSSLIDTLCHELAHLRHFNHGPEFKAFFLTLLGWARKQGIYQPGPARSSRRSRGVPRISSALDHRPFAQDLPLRNGIPIFPSMETEETVNGQRTLPWERTGRPQTPTGAANRAPRHAADPTSPKELEAPPAPPAPLAPAPGAPPGHHPREGAKPRAPEQLSLF